VPYAPDARPLGDLFSDLSRDISTLLRQEMALVRVEMGAKISRAVRQVGLLAFGAVIALTGLFTLAASFVLLLIRGGMSPSAAALLVGFALIALGGILAKRAFDVLRRQDLTPVETIETLRETAAWKRQTS
jgi:hypothetical protein